MQRYPSSTSAKERDRLSQFIVRNTEYGELIPQFLAVVPEGAKDRDIIGGAIATVKYLSFIAGSEAMLEHWESQRDQYPEVDLILRAREIMVRQLVDAGALGDAAAGEDHAET